MCYWDKKNPGIGTSLIYDDDDYSPGYSQTEEAFRALTKDAILQTYISDGDSRSSNARSDEVG